VPTGRASLGSSLAALVLLAVACRSGGGAAPTTLPPPTVATTTTATTTVPATTVAPTTTIPPTTTTVAPTTTTAPGSSYVIGQSVEGRPITVVERGTPGGKAVLVVGVIHGNEPAGLAVVKDLETMPVPDGVHLYLVESMNPDGQAHDTRQNAHQVDLNRNFPLRWAPLGKPGDDEYAGTGPLSEPESTAMAAFITKVRPDLSIWYHQDLNRLSPETGSKGVLVRRYAEMTGLPIVPVTGGTYTGTATPWEEQLVKGSAALLVELGPTLSAQEAATHADAVLALASSR
jgi:murein peptide amidase A